MLDNYQRAVIERSGRSPRNLNELALILRTVDEYPGLAVYNYTELTDLHETTFYRNVKILRQLGLLHQSRFKLNPKSEYKSETPVIHAPSIEDEYKKIPKSFSWMEDFVVSVAQNGISPEDKKVFLEAFGKVPGDKIAEATGIFALFALSCNRIDMYADKELLGDEELTVQDFVEKLEEHLKPELVETNQKEWYQMIPTDKMPPELRKLYFEWAFTTNNGTKEAQ